jgi:hypothetical protein
VLILLIAHTKVANPGICHIVKDKVIIDVGMFSFRGWDLI